MCRKDKNGFSLVELLAVVVIIGLLSAIAIVSVNSIIKNAEKKYYDTQKNTLKMAAQSYTQYNRNSLPKSIGQSRNITLKELKDKKYVGEIKNRQGTSCDVNKSYVKVFKYSKNSYNYIPYLVCPGIGEDDINDEGEGPAINITYVDNKKEIISSDSFKKDTYNNPMLELEFVSEREILSYSYTIYKCFGNDCSDTLKSSGSKELNHQKKFLDKIDIKEFLPLDFKLTINVVDFFGNKSNKTVKLSISDKNGPECGDKTGEGSNATWLNKTTTDPMREITVKCTDTNNSKCEREIYSQIFREDGKYGVIKISSTNNKVNNCMVGVYIDTVEPTTPVINNPYLNGAFGDFTITVSSTDATSGIDHFDYRYPNSSVAAEKEWKQFGEKYKTKVSLTVSGLRDETLEVRACDVAGNCSEISQTNIKISDAGCKYDGKLEKGAKYVNGQYTYTYNGRNGWAIKLTDIESTAPVTSEICNMVNGKPIVDASNMFSSSKAVSIDLSSFDTSKVTNMAGMFYNSAAADVEVSHFDTSKVTSMAHMFSGSKAKVLDVSNFNTSNVTNMYKMFYNTSVTKIDVSHFDTSKVTTMASMFYKTRALVLDVSHFDTSKVRDMNRMFANSQAKKLDLSHFDTSNVTDMGYMFYYAQAESLNMGNFNTSKVTDMSNMFFNAAATVIDVSGFNTSKVGNMAYMFTSAEATVLDVSHFDTSKVISMCSMFHNAKATVLDVSHFDTGNVTNMSWMLAGTEATVLDVSHFDTSKVTEMAAMFSNTKATVLDVSHFDTSKVTSMWCLFRKTKATVLDVSNFNTSKVTNMAGMFDDTKATVLDVSHFDTNNVTNMAYMFNNSQATVLNVSSFNTSKVKDMNSMFANTKVVSLDLSTFDTSNVTDMAFMFNNTKATTGYARTQADANKFNASNSKPGTLTFKVK